MSTSFMYPERSLSLFSPVAVFVCLVSLIAVPSPDGTAHALAEYGTVIDKDTAWEAGSEHTFDTSVVIMDGATLTIGRGVKIFFSGDSTVDGSTLLEVRNGSVTAVGTEAEPIVFAKKGDNKTVFSILFSSDASPKESVFEHVRIEGGGAMARKVQPSFLDVFIRPAYAREYWIVQSAVIFKAGRVTIRDSVFFGNGGADIWSPNPLDFGATDECDPFGSNGSHLIVENSDFKGSPGAPAFLSGAPDCDLSSTVTLKNDWYGSATGPRSQDHDDPTAKGIIGHVTQDGFSPTEFFAVCHTCASNVLFLPGIKASRLYMKNGSGKENQLWLPSYLSNDLSDLALDTDGKSVNDVYTRDVLDEVGIPIAGPNIYKSFLADLEKKKTDHVIADYVPFAYDWRMNVEDIANGDTPYPDGSRSLTDTVDSLAQSSRSGKVTIVAHSNGGLLAKALLTQLQDTGRAGLVDQVVFVGTPQMGAPISILSLLYGYKEDLLQGILASRADIRSLAQNMPGAYGLLPSSEYFKRSDDPLITFSSEHTRFDTFRSVYGGTIGDRGELTDFLSATKDGRAKPKADDVESENILRDNLLDEADATSGRLDTWTPPSGVEAIQIAGWGLDTIRGVDYAEKEATKCQSAGLTFIPTCTGIGTYEPIYEPKFTVDGDEVVTAPSALMLPEASNVKKYWVDLYDYNDNTYIDSNHANLLEIQSLRDFVSTLISHTENDSALPNYIGTSRPSDYDHAKPRIRMSLYSPLDISLTDRAGNHTGTKEITSGGVTSTIIEEGIPGSSYYRFGERKYVSFPAGEPVAVRLDGYDDGSYTLKLEEVAVTKKGEELLSHTTFANLPVNASTRVELSIPKEGLDNLSPLRADMNGDEPGGAYIVTPIADGTATFDASKATPAVPESRDAEAVISNVVTTTIAPTTTVQSDAKSSHSGKASSKKSASKRSTPKKKYEITGVTGRWKGRLLSFGLSPVSSAQTIRDSAKETPSAVLGAETQVPKPEISVSPNASQAVSILRTGLRFLFTSPLLSHNMVFFLWSGTAPGQISWP